MKSYIARNTILEYYPHFLPPALSDRYFQEFQARISWKQEKLSLFGKTHLQPRLTAFFADQGVEYAYSGIQLEAEPFSSELLDIKTLVERSAGMEFNSCLVNLYRDGKDSMGWHADNEKELGKNPVIASVSLGAERIFHLRHNTCKGLKKKYLLAHGSLLLMKGETQHFWKHQLPKTKRDLGPRLNLTFRKILTSPVGEP